MGPVISIAVASQKVLGLGELAMPGASGVSALFTSVFPASHSLLFQIAPHGRHLVTENVIMSMAVGLSRRRRFCATLLRFRP